LKEYASFPNDERQFLILMFTEQFEVELDVIYLLAVLMTFIDAETMS
jgi:hypothetical protein